MIFNIIDRRKRRYRWKSIDAILEATSHDNACDDSDEALPTENDIFYDERSSISLSEAVIWAQEIPCPVTLYLYDLGAAI